jgi:hypothetical protein
MRCIEPSRLASFQPAGRERLASRTAFVAHDAHFARSAIVLASSADRLRIRPACSATGGGPLESHRPN